jgi:hypothetical protein
MKTTNTDQEGAQGFLPDDYERPANESRYLKMKDEGEYRLRILSRPIVGWLDWIERDGKRHPLHYRMSGERPKPQGKDPIKHFWSFLVWSYKDSKALIFEVTQVGIQQTITALTKDPDWGTPFEYDLKITKKGTGRDTEYSVTPVPAKPFTFSDEVVEQLPNGLYLEALYDGKDPFEKTEAYTSTLLYLP